MQRQGIIVPQPTLQLFQERINTLQCATQRTFLLDWVANVLLIASSGESARSGADVPPGKSGSGRKRNQLQTGVNEFPRLNRNLGASGYETGPGWSGLPYLIKPGLGQTAPSPS